MPPLSASVSLCLAVLGGHLAPASAVTLSGPTCHTVAQMPSEPTGRPAPEQVKPPAAVPDAVLFEEAATRLSEAQADEWMAAATVALAADPADRSAAVRRMAVQLARRTTADALATYESWAAAAGREDLPLLDRLAAGVLSELERAPSAETRATALERQARLGDRQARERLLDATAGDAPAADVWHARAALARLGDTVSADIVAAAANERMGAARLSALMALRAAPPTPAVLAAIDRALASEDPTIQAAAADLAGESGSSRFIAALRRVEAQSRYDAPLRAAAALLRLGDRAGLARLNAAVAGPLADARVLAARALGPARAATWAPAVLPLLDDRNLLARVQAAELLLPTHRARALDALRAAAQDPNPILRAEALRVLAADRETGLDLLRAHLFDHAPGIRLLAAGAVRDRAAVGGAAPGKGRGAGSEQPPEPVTGGPRNDGGR